jgi:ribose transport system substrate-binding protein
VAAISASVFAACGESKSDSSASDIESDSTTVDSGGAETAPADPVATSKAILDELYSGQYTEAPSAGPKAQKGKNVWVLSCGQAAEGCSYISETIVEAGKELGWNVTLSDGKFNADNAYTTAIRQAVAAGADGIVVDGVDCDLIKQPLAEAVDAGVSVVGYASYPCADGTNFTGTAIFSEELPTEQSRNEAWGRAQAYYTIAKSDGKANVISIKYSGVQIGDAVYSGFKEVMDQCAECTVSYVEVVLADLANGNFSSKVDSALLNNPDATVIHAPFDSFITLGLAAAVQRAGREDMLVLAGGGYPSNIRLIRDDNGQDAGVSGDLAWDAWSAADALNRIFAGEQPVPAGNGYVAVDRDRNLPTSGDVWNVPYDFRAAYRAVWGV